MNYLNLRQGVAALRLAVESEPGEPLTERAQPYLALTPHLLLDLEGILLTSLHLGELVNLANAARSRWGARFPGLLLLRASEQARRTIALARLEDLMRAYPSADAALAAIDVERAPPFARESAATARG
jgi:hypothetical protein